MNLRLSLSCTALPIQGLVFFRPEDVALKEILAKWAISFPKVLMCHLRESGSVQQELQVGGKTIIFGAELQ